MARSTSCNAFGWRHRRHNKCDRGSQLAVSSCRLPTNHRMCSPPAIACKFAFLQLPALCTLQFLSRASLIIFKSLIASMCVEMFASCTRVLPLTRNTYVVSLASNTFSKKSGACVLILHYHCVFQLSHSVLIWNTLSWSVLGEISCEDPIKFKKLLYALRLCDLRSVLHVIRSVLSSFGSLRFSLNTRCVYQLNIRVGNYVWPPCFHHTSQSFNIIMNNASFDFNA